MLDYAYLQIARSTAPKLADICPSCGSTDPHKMGDGEPCRNQFHANAGFPRDPSDNAVRDARG